MSPAEGTVGTQVTITGSGFGEKLGEVLIGTEKCKVLSWSDASISCVVQKPQSPGYYPVTVLLQGEKKPAEPLTFEGFAMRRPKIIPGADPVLVPEGDTLTINGEFFGDKKGDLSLAYLKGGPDGEPAVVDLKIVDWNMDTIRFGLPGDLTGKFVLVVSNEVGAGLALLDLGGDQPLLIDYTFPPIDGTYGNLISRTNASGVYFDGIFYVFGTGQGCVYSWCNGPIRVWTFTNNTLSEGYTLGDTGGKKGETNATPVSLVVGDMLWLFHNAGDGRILYQRFDGTNWIDLNWHQVKGSTSDTWEVAPIYYPGTGRVEVFHASGGSLYRSYSDDGGTTWKPDSPQKITLSVSVSSAPGAVVYQHPTLGPIALVAFKDSTGKGQIYSIKDGQAIASLYSLSDVDDRPFLVDDKGSGFIALIVAINNDPLGNTLKNQVWIHKMDKATGTWDTLPAQEVKLPDKPPYGEGHYYYNDYWPPNGAINFSSGDRILNLFYGDGFYSYDDKTVTDAVWTMDPFDNLDD